LINSIAFSIEGERRGPKKFDLALEKEKVGATRVMKDRMGNLVFLSSNLERVQSNIAALKKSHSHSDQKLEDPSICCQQNDQGEIDYCWSTIQNLIPKNIVNLYNKQSLIDGPNCFNAALFAKGIIPTLGASDENELVYWIYHSGLCKETPQPVPGAIVIITNDDGEDDIHAYVRLSEDISFTKNGIDRLNEYEFTNDARIREIYSQTPYEKYFICQGMDEYLKNNPKIKSKLEKFKSCGFTETDLEKKLIEDCKNNPNIPPILDVDSEESIFDNIEDILSEMIKNKSIDINKARNLLDPRGRMENYLENLSKRDLFEERGSLQNLLNDLGYAAETNDNLDEKKSLDMFRMLLTSQINNLDPHSPIDKVMNHYQKNDPSLPKSESELTGYQHYYDKDSLSVLVRARLEKIKGNRDKLNNNKFGNLKSENIDSCSETNSFKTISSTSSSTLVSSENSTDKTILYNEITETVKEYCSSRKRAKRNCEVKNLNLFNSYLKEWDAVKNDPDIIKKNNLSNKIRLKIKIVIDEIILNCNLKAVHTVEDIAKWKEYQRKLEILLDRFN
jgi:hypothetical protein